MHIPHRQEDAHALTGFTVIVFILHHHLLPIPGTGRERNVVHDAGDTLDQLAPTLGFLVAVVFLLKMAGAPSYSTVP